MRREFFITSFLVISFTALFYMIWPPIIWTLVVTAPLIVLGMCDAFQTKRAVRRNFPIIGNFRYWLEMVRPELQQYFVESNLSGRPIPRELRSIVYQRAKGEVETLPFGTQRDIYSEGHEWINHSLAPQNIKNTEFKIRVGGPQCKKPYDCSIFNISAMSYGSLSRNAIEALNKGAKIGGFAHNTGEGSISPYHLCGGDLIWQIGTAYFGCRNEDGSFSDEKFKEKANLDAVKMIEVKLSQGAKPSKGGMLPGVKVTEEVAAIRGVPVGKSVESPASHPEFNSPVGLLNFIQRLRDLTDGKPVGFKLCVGKPEEFLGICKAMKETGIFPDFITVDGAEGGTGAAPLEFTNSVGTPGDEGLVFVHDALTGFGLRPHIRVFASGKVITAFNILTKMAMGADAVNCGRGMMLALGCIQALKCNTNDCPVGVATTNPHLVAGLNVSNKVQRVANYHRETLHAFAEILAASGCKETREITRADVYRRLSDGVIKSYEEIFPVMPFGALLQDLSDKPQFSRWHTWMKRASARSFSHREGALSLTNDPPLEQRTLEQRSKAVN